MPVKCWTDASNNIRRINVIIRRMDWNPNKYTIPHRPPLALNKDVLSAVISRRRR